MDSLFLLTQNTNAIIGPIARVLGWIMNGIFVLFDNLFEIQNIALTIVIFTIVIYLIMLPLTYQQQKFSKMTQIMQPEIQAIQKKYRNKKDSASMQAQNEETQAVYRKYGVRPSGSCVFLVIQFLILIPLYRVINNVPGYVTRVKDAFTSLVDQIYNTTGFQASMTNFFDLVSENNRVMRQVTLDVTGEAADVKNSIIDVLYRCTHDNWDQLISYFPHLEGVIQNTQDSVDRFTGFLGTSVVYSPMVLIRTSIAAGAVMLVIVGILIPVISAGTQFLSVRLMPQANTGSQDQMGNSMRMMNYIMPIYSFFIVFTLPIGIGIYWIAGAVIRIVQQWLINRHFSRIDMQALVDNNAKKAEEKRQKKIERKGVSGAQIQSAASINTKQIPRSMAEKAGSVAKVNAQTSGGKSSSSGGKTNSTKSKSSSSKGKSSSSKSKNTSSKVQSAAAKEQNAAAQAEETAELTDQPRPKYKEGSMAALANKVAEYNEKNSRGSKK